MTAAEDVQQHMSGDGLPEAIADMLYEAHAFGLSKDYAHPEGSNTSPARYDQITTLAKLLTRKRSMPDGNQYDAWDMLVACTRYVLTQNPTIMSVEPESVNYKAPPATS